MSHCEAHCDAMDNTTHDACVLLATVARHPLSIPLCVANVLLLAGAFVGSIDLLVALRRSVTVPVSFDLEKEAYCGYSCSSM